MTKQTHTVTLLLSYYPFLKENANKLVSVLSSTMSYHLSLNHFTPCNSYRIATAYQGYRIVSSHIMAIMAIISYHIMDVISWLASNHISNQYTLYSKNRPREPHQALVGGVRHWVMGRYSYSCSCSYYSCSYYYLLLVLLLLLLVIVLVVL